MSSSSLGLTEAEKNYLYSITLSTTLAFSNPVLLYRASRDGFAAEAFHDRCDRKKNTVTIIKNNLNFIFGGFTAAKWNSNNVYIPDPYAFIFSLRRNGTLSNYKLMISSSDSDYAIGGASSIGPVFGHGPDIYINDQSNTDTGSHSLISSYTPPIYPPGSDESTFLTGGFENWLTSEIEVYQLSVTG